MNQTNKIFTYAIQYGIALKDFKTNGIVVNDSILTLLRYLNDDLGRTDILCESRLFFRLEKYGRQNTRQIILKFACY